MRILVALLVALVLVGGILLPSRAADEREPAGRFDVHTTCALCHDETRRGSAMQDASGRNVAPVDLWRSSMMANASRDPLWRAVVAIETGATPSRASDIEALCLRCHAPMAPSPSRVDDLFGGEHAGALALDGVSCTVCHGIRDAGLGTEPSFSGGWTVGDDGRLFGPHRHPFDRPMRNHTDFVPEASEHVLDPALCATCHTLFTRALDADGRETDATLPEQTPYLEWRNSAFSTETPTPGPDAATCRDCHLPTTDLDDVPIETRIAHNPGGRDFPPTDPRVPFGRHVMVGGNALVPSLLRGRFAVPEAATDETLRRVDEQLKAAARLSLEGLTRREGVLEVDLRVENLAGHRLPTAHPTRRLWLALEVRDAGGVVVFASGAFDAQGRIVGGDGQPLPSELAGGPLPVHRTRVTSPDEVALYDARMEDASGAPTWLLTRGARFAKDDRLLPKGWRSDGPHADAAGPVGTDGDEDFGAGGDVVHYRIPLAGSGDAEFTVSAVLFHQTLGARWAAELVALDLPAARALRAVLAAAELGPSEVARLDVRAEAAD